eukprot:g11851.t1
MKSAACNSQRMVRARGCNRGFSSTVTLPSGKTLSVPVPPVRGPAVGITAKKQEQATASVASKLYQRFAVGGETGLATTVDGGNVEAQERAAAASFASGVVQGDLGATTDADHASSDTTSASLTPEEQAERAAAAHKQQLEAEAELKRKETAKRMRHVKHLFACLNSAANQGKWSNVEGTLLELESTEQVSERVQMYNIALKGLAKAFKHQDAANQSSQTMIEKSQELYERLIASGTKPSSYTYSALVNCCIEANRFDKAEHWFGEFKKQFAESSGSGGSSSGETEISTDDREVLYSSMMNGSFKAGNPEAAEKYFELFAADSGVRPSLVSYGTMLYGFARRCDNLGKALEYLEMMQADNVTPNAVCYTALISYCAKRSDPIGAEGWMEKMLSQNVPADAWCYNALIHTFIKAELTDKAVYWTLEKACKDKNVKRSELRIDGLLRLACNPSGGGGGVSFAAAEGNAEYSVEQVEQLFAAQSQRDLVSFNMVILYMWAKGEGEKAKKYFFDLKKKMEPNSYTHYAMMRGSQSAGRGGEAIEHFDTEVKEADRNGKISNLFLRLLIEEGHAERASEHREWMDAKQFELDALSRMKLGIEKESIPESSDTPIAKEDLEIFTNTVVDNKAKIINKATPGSPNHLSGNANKVVDWEATVKDDESIVFKNLNSGAESSEQPAFGWVRVMDARYGAESYYWDVQSNVTQWTTALCPQTIVKKMMVLMQWLFLHTAVTSAAAAPTQQMYLAHSYKPKTHSWHNCGRGPNCLFRDVCFPIETKCADAFHHNCALIAEKRAEVVSTSEFFLREKIAKREAHAYDLFRRKLVFFQHREVVFTIVDRYNMENLFVEPHLSDSQHLRRARAQNVPDVVPSDAHVHVTVKRCGQTVGGCGGSNPQAKGESAGSATCTAQTQYVFMLFRPSLIARRKPYGNMLFDDLGSLYMSLKYFGLEEKVSGADFSSGEGVQQEGAGKNYQLILLLDSALDDEERAVLDFIVPREFVWTRVDEQSGDLKSWGTVLAEKLPTLEQGGCSNARPAVDVGANGELSAAADKSQGEVIDGKEDLVCVKNLITGFAAAGFANSDEIHNHLSTPAYKEVYDDAVGMALSLGLDRGGTSVPDLLGFRRFLYAMRAKMGFVPSSGATPGSAGLAPTNVMKILVALPCCPSEYFSDAGGGTTSPAELDVARTGRTITQIVPLAGEHRDSVVVGKPMVASRYVLDNDGVAIPGNHPRCAKFSVSKEKIEAAVRKIVEKMNGKGVQVQRRGYGVYAPGEGEDSSVAEPAVGEKKKFEVSFVNSCECLPGYFVEKEIVTGKQSRVSTSGKASMYASTMLTLLNHVDVLFTLAGFDNFEHDAFVTQAVLLPKLSTILAPYRSAEQKDKSRIDEAAFNVFNMETLFPRHTRVLPHHYGPLFQLRRSFRHRPYLNVVEWPMYAVGAWSSSDAVGVSFSYNVTKHKSFLRRNLLKYTGRRLGIEDIEEGSNPVPPKTSGTATAGGREVKENPIDPVATRTAEKNPTHSLAYSFCDKDMEKTNVGEYCQVQIWSAGGCANLPLAFGGPQDFYKWFYAQNFQTFVSDTTEWATSSELRHWRVCYGMSMDPHVVARRENLEKELIRRTGSSGVDAKSRYSFAYAKAPWSAFVSKKEEQKELRDLSDEAVVAGIDHLRNKEAELQKQKYSTTAAYADVPGWRMATAANQYSPGLLGVLRLPCPRRSYQREVEGENGVIELSDRDEGVGSERFDGHSRRGRCALVFAPTVGWSGKTPVKSRSASAGPEADESSLRLPFDEATGQTTLQSRSSDLLRPTGRAEAAVVFAHTKMQVPVVDDATVVAKEAGLTTHIDGYYRPTYGNYTYHFLPPMGERETDGQKGVRGNAEEEALRRAVAVELAKPRPPTSSYSLPVVGVEDVVGDETESESAEVATSGREVSTFTESVVPEAIELGADFADYFGQHLANAAAHAERHAERKEEEFFVSASFSSPSAVKDKPTSSHTTGKRRSGFASASQPGSTTSGSSASSTDAFLRQQQYSSHLCNLGPNCYFQNVCFQQFSNHNQAKPLPPHGHMHHKKITLELDLAYAMPREEHVLLTNSDSRADLKVLPGSALGKLWTSVNFPVLANRKDECAEIRVNVYTSPENSADVSTTEINEENESEESEVSSNDFASLNTANRLGQDQLREWGTADFKQLLDAVRSADVPLLAESEEEKDVYFSRFTRGPGEMDRIFFPRIVESHPLWDFVRTSGASNSVDDEDRKLLEK